MSSTGIGAVPPPLFKLPWGSVHEGTDLVYLNTASIGFLTQLWNAIAGAGGIIPSFISIPVAAAGAITAYNAVTINNIGQASAPDITVIADGLGLVGIATNTGSVGSTITVQSIGIVTNSAWTWTPGSPVWCGVGGTLTQTPPSTAGDWVRRVGVALDATDLILGLGDLVELT